MTRLALAFALTLVSSAAFAQAPFPGAVKVGEGWVPCSHPLAVQSGLGCESATPSPSVDNQFPWTAGTSPYVPPTDSGLRFELRKIYRAPYGAVVRIVGTITLTNGEMVFVGECLGDIQSSCPKDRLLRFGLSEDRGAFFWEVTPAELPLYVP